MRGTASLAPPRGFWIWTRARVGLAAIWLLSVSGMACAVATDRADSPAPRPNILFLLCDDLGYGDLGCYGHPHIQTPNLDQLAAQGIRFTHCYAAAPVCSPSRAGLLTGRTPNRLGIRDWIPARSGIFLRREEITVAERLHDAGYRTGLVGKWHVSSRLDGHEPTPDTHGFEYWFCTQNNAAPSHQDPTNFVRMGKPIGPLKGHSTTLIVDEAIRFIEREREDSRPWMLFVWFHAPHEPVATPPEYTALYPDVTPRERAIYFGSVSLVDHEVGRLLQRLEKLKLAERTFVFFSSDNGPETLHRYRGARHSYGSPGPLRGMKLHLYEGGYRVPGILRWPGHVPRGRVCATPICGMDLLPTLCELAGAKLPADVALDGTSLVPLIEGREFRRRQPLFWEYDYAIRAPWRLSLREGRWKLLTDLTFSRFELYDLQADTSEAYDESWRRPKQVRRMTKRLKQIYRDVCREAERSEHPLEPLRQGSLTRP